MAEKLHHVVQDLNACVKSGGQDDDGGALQALVRVSATTRDPDVVHVGVEVASEEAGRPRRPRPRSDPGPAQ